MKRKLLLLLLCVLLALPAHSSRPTPTSYPYVARVRADTTIYDTIEDEWTQVLYPWFVQVDYSFATMCFIEWNTQTNPDPNFYHHEGLIVCDRLTGPVD